MSDKISLIDTHFHLDKYQNHSSLYELMNKNHQYTLCVTCSPGVFLSCKKLYPETKYVKFALGVHPKEITDPEKSIHEFNICLHQAKYIGEIGLDYSGASPSRDIQLNVFRHIIKKQAERNEKGGFDEKNNGLSLKQTSDKQGATNRCRSFIGQSSQKSDPFCHI